MTIAKFLACSLLLCLASNSLLSQGTSGSIKGVLKDSSGKQVLSLATVTVFIAKDTTIITYRLSDASGSFRVPGLPLNIGCRVLVSFSGYKTYRKDFTLTKESPQLDFGTINLISDANSLEEVTVYAERPPVTIRKDTIEFNASAFKTLPSALLEDLLKKFPGIDIDPSGNIMVKGKRVNKLLVEGKEFFGGDPLIATKNLPADIVDKVQVMNDKEEIDKNPDTPESEIGQVINIKLKKAIKQGWFGKAYAGAGTNNRHELGAIVNAFKDTAQISLLGYTNNINKAGFGISDIQKIGGFSRSGYNSIMMTSDGGIALNDISFGGTGQGLQRSTGGGINYNNQYGKKVTLNLQYFYGQVNSEFTTKSNQQRFFKDTVLTTLSSSNPSSVSMNHRIGGTVVWKLDSLTTLTVRPGLTLTSNRSNSEGNTATSENYRGKINSSSIINSGSGKSNNFSTNMLLVRLFKKKGRSLTLNSDFSNSNNANDNFTDGVYSTFGTGLQSDSFVNQLRQTIGDNLRASAYLYYNEPINNVLSLRLSHTVEFLKQNNSIDFLNKDNFSGKYDEFNNEFSNSIARTGMRNTSSANLTIKLKKISFRPGLAFFHATTDNDFTRNPSITQRFRYLYPTMSVTWGQLSVSYQGYIQEPDAASLQKVIDISNRFYQQFGNPDLKPAFVNTFNINYSKFYPKSGSSISAYASGGITDNYVIRQLTIDRNGIQTTRPINVDGTYRANAQFSYSYQYKFNKDFRLTLRPNVFGSYNKSFVLLNGLRAAQNNISVQPGLSFGINYKDLIELNQRYSESYRQSTYANTKAYRNVYVLTHYVESELVIRMPKHFVWENLINYTYNPQVAQGLRKSVVRWNAGINYLFLKDDKAQIKLSVYDLLNQNISVYRTTGENYISDVGNSTLTRYFMLTFTYNLRNFTAGKVGGKDRSIFLF